MLIGSGKKNEFKTTYPVVLNLLGIKSYIIKNTKYRNRDKLEECCNCIIYNIMLRKRIFAKNGYILIYRTPRKYPLNGYSYDTVLNSVKILQELNIIIEIKGYKHLLCKNKTTNEWIPKNIIDKKTKMLTSKIDSQATKISLLPASDWKLDLLETQLSWYEFATKIFSYNDGKDKDSVIFREKVKNKKIRLDITVPPTILNEINDVNSFLTSKGFSELAYQRIFGSSVNKGGRIFNIFQTIPKDLRKKIYEQEGWEEIDFPSFNPSLLYYIALGPISGKKIGADIYDSFLQACNLPSDYRPIAKKIMLMVIGTKSRSLAEKAVTQFLSQEVGLYTSYYGVDTEHDAWDNAVNFDMSQLRYDQYKLDSGINPKLIPFKMNTKFLLDTLERVHEPIKHFFYCDIHYLVQNLESKIILKIIQEMMRLDILPITIHDCVIVPKRHAEYFENFKWKIFQEVANTYKHSPDYLKLFNIN